MAVSTFDGANVDITGLRFAVQHGLIEQRTASMNPQGSEYGWPADDRYVTSVRVAAHIQIDGTPKLQQQTHTPGKFLFTPTYVAVPAPRTTAETLAVAVMCGEPCGRQLVDCLIEEGVVDPESALAEKVKADTLAKVDDVISKVVTDILHADESRSSDYTSEYHVLYTARHIRRLISELA